MTLLRWVEVDRFLVSWIDRLIISINDIWSLGRQGKSIRAKLDNVWLLNDLLLPFTLDYAVRILHMLCMML